MCVEAAGWHIFIPAKASTVQVPGPLTELPFCPRDRQCLLWPGTVALTDHPCSLKLAQAQTPLCKWNNFGNQEWP